MPLSDSHCYILKRIADISVQNDTADSLISQIIYVLRGELGIQSLSVILGSSTECKQRVWHDQCESAQNDLEYLQDQALAIFDRNEGSTSQTGFIYELAPVNDRRAAIIGLGSHDGTDECSLVHFAASYIQLLLRNIDIEESLYRSNETANQHLNEIATIYEISQATGTADVTPLLNLIVTKASAVMDAQACSLLLSDNNGTLVIQASCGLADDIVNKTRVNYGEGIAGHVAVTGEPMLISDVVSDPRLSDDIRPRKGISGSMCVPLKDENGQVYGVLNIRRHVPKQPFTKEDLRLFQVFATHASLAISNAELYSRLKGKITEMASISDVLRTVNSSLSLDHRLNKIAEAIKTVVGFDRCCVYLLDEKTNEFIARAKQGYMDQEVVLQRVSAATGVFSIAAGEGIPVFTKSLSSYIDGPEDQLGELLVAPIMVKESCIGVVVVDNSISETRVDNEQVELLSTFVSQAGIAVEHARLYEAMQQKYNELNVLYEHSRTISAAYGLQQASDALLQSCVQAIKCTGAGVILMDNLRGSARLIAGRGDTKRIASDINHIINTPQGIQHIRNQRQPVLHTSTGEGRSNCPFAAIYDNQWHAKKNLLLVPLITEDTVIGAVVMARHSNDPFKEHDIKLCSIIAGHAATVIRNAYEVEQKMSRRILELTALYDFSNRITASANMNEALESILTILGNLVDYDLSQVYVVDKETNMARAMVARSRSGPAELPEDESLEEQGIVSWIANEAKAIMSPDISRDRRFITLRKPKSKYRSMMAIPLIVHGEVIAALTVQSENPKQYSEDSVRVLSIIASLGAAIFSELEALNQLSSYTDNILASIVTGVATLDKNMRVISWNSAAEKATGISADQITGKRGTDALSLLPITDENRAVIRQAIGSVIDTGETFHGYKMRFKKTDAHNEDSEETDDTVIFVNMNISLLRNKTGSILGLVVIFEDTTHEIEMENKFHRMSELASIGQLAANIAHELRNPLSSIKGAAQFLQNEYSTDAAISEFLGIIIDEVNGLNSLTTEFLDFARPLQLSVRPTSINKIVSKNLQLMSMTIKDNNVSLNTNLEHNLPEIQADAKQIEQILKNVILNALQAMPGGGELHITTESRTGGVCLSITDTGSGIPRDKIARIFQPFYTTKTKGTGLGLSIVNKIVENHGGRIEVDSDEGVGTCVKIILPTVGEGPIISTLRDDALERRVSRGIREL